MEAKIYRAPTSENGIFGNMSLDNISFCTTLERPDFNFDGIIGNEKNNSCIPEGIYICRRRIAEIVKKCFHTCDFVDIDEEVAMQLTRGETFEVYGATCGETDNCQRKSVLFHPANIIEDLEGCIGVGSGINTIKKDISGLGIVERLGITNSRYTFAKFMQQMKGIDEFQLTITKRVL
jgi:hypothetical protein